MYMQRMFSRPLSQRDRVTATEVIDGAPCLVVLEQDIFGCYREMSVHPLPQEVGDRGWAGHAALADALQT